MGIDDVLLVRLAFGQHKEAIESRRTLAIAYYARKANSVQTFTWPESGLRGRVSFVN